jgi:hypothetical protein
MRSDTAPTVPLVLQSLLQRPGDLLLRQWNWKSALLSSCLRSQIFLAANWRAGWDEALGAMMAEFLLRGATAGFYGALTQSFRAVEPAWQGVVTILLLLPVTAHGLELLVHWLRGTPNLGTSIAGSVCFTALSASFNWFAMRQGAFMVGRDAASLAADIRRLPELLGGFVVAGPRSLWRRWRTERS